MRWVAPWLVAWLLQPAPCGAQGMPEELPDDYLPFTFVLTDSGLVGASDFLPGFRFSMNLSRERFPHGLDLEGLVAALRSDSVTGTLTAPSGSKAPITYEMVHFRGPEEIYMKTTQGYFPWEYVSVSGDTLRMAIYWWFCPPATQADLTALEMAARLLADPAHWHQEDDRDCADDQANDRWSLFCALKHASIETTGEYNHHNTATQTVRFVIEELYPPDHEFAHTLMDYNNLPTTTHADILQILDEAHERIAAALAKRESAPEGH